MYDTVPLVGRLSACPKVKVACRREEGSILTYHSHCRGVWCLDLDATSGVSYGRASHTFTIRDRDASPESTCRARSTLPPFTIREPIM